MRTFRLLKPVYLALLTPQDSIDVLAHPAPDGKVEYDGSDIYFRNNRGRWCTKMANHMVEEWLKDGSIEEIV